MNIIPGDDSMTFEREIHRGEIFYMTFKEQVGSEQQGGRPVIVVSNETCNKFSPTVTIVPLTTKDKKPLPTHVELNIGRTSCVRYDFVRASTKRVSLQARQLRW